MTRRTLAVVAVLALFAAAPRFAQCPTAAPAHDFFVGPASRPSTRPPAQAAAPWTPNSSTPPQLQPGTPYEWRVEAIGAGGCPGVFSPCIRFTPPGPACVPPGAFSLVSPA